MVTFRMNHKQYKYYDLVMAAFVTVLLCSNLIGPAKLSSINLFGWKLEYGTGNLFFPFSYIFGDVLTEVYGYARSRRVIWAGFVASVFAAVMSALVVHIPSTMGDDYQTQLQHALELVLGNTTRIVIASLIAFFCGEFVNSFVLAKMKILTRGKYLWTRTIGSTVFGQFVDSFIFYPVAFYGLWSNHDLIKATLLGMAFKISWEVLLTPVTYAIVGKLKKIENEDYYDTNTNFTPFSLKDS